MHCFEHVDYTSLTDWPSHFLHECFLIELAFGTRIIRLALSCTCELRRASEAWPPARLREEVTGKRIAGDGCHITQPTMSSVCGDLVGSMSGSPRGEDSLFPASPAGDRSTDRRAREVGGLGMEAGL